MLTQGLQKAWERFWQADALCWNKVERLLRGQQPVAAKRDAIAKVLHEYNSIEEQFLRSAGHFAAKEDRDWFVEEIEKAQKRIAFHVAQEADLTYDLPSVRAMPDAPSSRDGPSWPKYKPRESEVCGKLDAEELVNETVGIQAALRRLTKSLAEKV